MTQILRNKRWIFSSRPGEDKVGSAHYTYDEVDMEASCAANEVIVESQYISVDPYMRIHQAERFTFDVPHPFGVVQGEYCIHIINSKSCCFLVGFKFQ